MKLGYFTTLIFGIISMTTILHSITAKGLTIELIHRDLVQSPSLIALSPSQRLINALRRSFNRINTPIRHRSSSATPIDILSDSGEYLMKFSIGTPPVETLAIADTGSDLTWIQCKPCTNCFHQKAPLFEPKLSSTYKPTTCTSSTCNALVGRTSCEGSTGNCRYTIGYGDTSFSNGYLATETIRFGSVAISDVVVGCGHNDRGTFGAHASGIVGLGGGQLSLINQMGSLTQGRFSYCLGSFYSGSSFSSQMSFGDDAIMSGDDDDDVTTTPLVVKDPNTFYFLTLEGISVGNQRIDNYSPLITSSSNGSDDEVIIEEGNIILDSGTTLTFLPKELYNKVEREVKRRVKNMKEMDDPRGLLNLCYATSGLTQVPEIIFHFKGGDVELKPHNTFVKTGDDCVCLGFAETSSEAIFGNLAQMDFMVGYDLQNKTVSFKPADCSEM